MDGRIKVILISARSYALRWINNNNILVCTGIVSAVYAQKIIWRD